MNATSYIFANPSQDCPPADWMAGGSCDPEAQAAYGFTEAQVVSAVTAAYMDVFVSAPAGVSRQELRAAMVGAFVDALEQLGA